MIPRTVIRVKTKPPLAQHFDSPYLSSACPVPLKCRSDRRHCCHGNFFLLCELWVARDSLSAVITRFGPAPTPRAASPLCAGAGVPHGTRYSLSCVRAAWGRAPKSLGGRPAIAAGTQLLARSFSGRPVGGRGGPPLTRGLYSLPVIFGSPPPRSRKATLRRNLFSLADDRQVARAGRLPSGGPVPEGTP